MSKDAETGRRTSMGDQNEVEQETVQDIARYSTKTFVTWKCFMIQEKTVFRSSKLWVMMGYLTVVSLAVALVTLIVVPNPSVLKVGKFTDVSKFLNVVVGLLLGFFMSSSMNRWFTCVDGFLQLLDAIRNLQLQFIGLGVPNVELGLCMRYGLLSGWLMYFSLLDDADNTVPDESTEHMDMVITKLQQQSKMWRHQGIGLGDPQALKEQSFSLDLTEAERSALKKTHDPAAMVWVWVAGLIGRLAQDGFIPPMASPTYGRIMNLCQQAHSGIRDIAGSMKVQPPLIYTHMLATLVHVNNLLNALTFGLVLGLSVGTVLQFTDMHPFHPRDTSHGTLETLMKESQRDGQTAVVTFMYCFLGPSIYQAFLLIGMELAQPFDSEEAKIPLHRFLLSLERDLQDGSMIANQMCFDKPCFKPPSRASAEIAPDEFRRASICWSAPAEP